MWLSEKNPAGLASIAFKVNPLALPESVTGAVPVVLMPVTNGAVRQPYETRSLSSPTGLGNAMRGGPEAPRAAA